MDLNGWLPSYAYLLEKQLLLDWCYTGARRFTAPFFPDTIDQVCRDYAVKLFRHQTTMAEAKEWVQAHPGLSPSGFIFHMSRCGSTLVSQMLAALPRNRMLSEPAAIHMPLRAGLLDYGFSRAEAIECLQTVVGALGRPLPGESRYFLKLDCWHVLALPFILEAFPQTPWIFLYRNPAEVLVSQVRAPGAWTVPSALEPELFGLSLAEFCSLPPHEYRARALSRICEAAVTYSNLGRGMFVNYDQLPEIVWGDLIRHFGASADAAEGGLMQRVAQADAKMPQLPFSDDRRAKREAVTPVIQATVDRLLTPLFDRLEEIRQSAIPYTGSRRL
jgi:hypothetical protein